MVNSENCLKYSNKSIQNFEKTVLLLINNLDHLSIGYSQTEAIGWFHNRRAQNCFQVYSNKSYLYRFADT